MQRDNNQANVAVFGLVVASSLFAVSFATIVQVSVDRQEDEAWSSHDLDATAHRLADVLLTTPGHGWYEGGPACVAGQRDPASFTPDSVAQIGLLVEPCENDEALFGRVSNLSFDKFFNLYQALHAADPANGFLDYQEARTGLQLAEAGLDFHLRTWPVLPDVTKILATGHKDPNLRPLYIGDYEETGGSGEVLDVQRVAGHRANADTVDLFVNVTNNGTTTTAFSVLFKVKTESEIVTERHTWPLAPDASGNVTFRLNKTSDWAWADDEPRFEYVVRDPGRTVGEGTVFLPADALAGPTLKRQYIAEAGQLSWVLQGSVQVDVVYDALDGSGSSNVQESGWTMEIVNQTGAVVASNSGLKAKGGKATFTITDPGEFTANVKSADGSLLQFDAFTVTEDDLDRFNAAGVSGTWTPSPPVASEIGFIDALVDHFDANVVDADFDHPSVPYAPGGDVFPDDNQALADRLPDALLDGDGNATLTNYNMLFVGTDVDHDSMTSANIKITIRDWVLAGGTLVVFGSQDQAVQWLQPLFHVSLASAGDGVGIPDATHPLLRVPNRLDYPAFDDHGTAWRFNQDSYRDRFTHVVLNGEDDVLGVSDPGAFGRGRILLTSWQPYDLVEGGMPPGCDVGALTDACPSLQVVLNFMTLAYRGLYLDYGPSVPILSPQGVATRVGATYHPELMQLVEVHMLLFVFA